MRSHPLLNSELKLFCKLEIIISSLLVRFRDELNLNVSIRRYPMGDETSINLQLGQQQNYMAYVLTHNLAMQARKQNKVRQELTAAHGSKLSVSIN